MSAATSCSTSLPRSVKYSSTCVFHCKKKAPRKYLMKSLYSLKLFSGPVVAYLINENLALKPISNSQDSTADRKTPKNIYICIINLPYYLSIRFVFFVFFNLVYKQMAGSMKLSATLLFFFIYVVLVMENTFFFRWPNKNMMIINLSINYE